MPHIRQPPETIEDILATSTPDPEWTAIQEEHPLPRGKDWGDDPNVIKQMSIAMLPRLRATLDASRPNDVSEKDIYIDIPSTKLKSDGGRIRVLVCQPATLEEAKPSPIIILYHGGGHTVGNPESELPLARLLVQQYHAVVVLPAYRLAPEHKYPSTFSDSFEVLKIVAGDIALLKQEQNQQQTSSSPPATPQLLDPKTIPSTSFTIGGTSAGGTISASINHLYYKYRSSSTPPLPLSPITSLLLSCGSSINPLILHKKYQPFFLSREQNVDEPPVDEHMYKLFKDAAQLDHTDPLWGSFDQRPELAGERESVADDHVWMAGSSSSTSLSSETATTGTVVSQPPMRVYLQVCGCDMARDDSLIYERVLREECGVETRLDLYSGFGHVFWGMGGGYAGMEMSKKRLKDSVEGVGWMIGIGG